VSFDKVPDIFFREKVPDTLPFLHPPARRGETLAATAGMRSNGRTFEPASDGRLHMNEKLRHAWHIAKTPLRIALGAVLVLVGILGLVLPIMPGWIFIFPGLALLMPGTRAGHWLRAKAQRLRAKMGRGGAENAPAPPSPPDGPTP